MVIGPIVLFSSVFYLYVKLRYCNQVLIRWCTRYTGLHNYLVRYWKPMYFAQVCVLAVQSTTAIKMNEFDKDVG